MKLKLKISLSIFLFIVSSVSVFSQDTDNDGILNSIDIDDDNDGVPDVIEDNCNPILFPTNVGAKATTSVPPGWSIAASSPDIVDVTGSPYGVWNVGCTSTAPAAPNGHTKWVFISSPTGESFKTTIKNLVVGKTYTFTYYCGKFGGFGFMAGQFTVKLGTTTIDQYTPTSGCGWDTRTLTFTASATSQDLTFIATGTGNTCANISVSENAIVSDCDFDNDGIVNSQDLDSDGDGCSDAFESGATTSTTANFSFSGAVGTNGLINIKETVVDNGLLNYSPTYTDYALNTISACVDSDGDGIKDVNDLDDDNDGIVDLIENTKRVILLDEDFGATACNGFTTDYVPCSNAGAGYTFLSPQNGGYSPDNGNSFSQGQFLSVNASVNPAQDFYRNTINVLPYQTYTFSFYAGINSVASGNSTIVLEVDGIKKDEYPLATTSTWTQYTTKIYTGSATSITIGLSEALAYAGGDDFGVDDIKLELPIEAVSTALNDLDKDGIINSLDLDSDGDGCEDAIEGGENFTTSNLVSSTMNGGNTGTNYTGTSSTSVTKNLGNTVGSLPTTLGIPTIANLGQTINYSQQKTLNGCINSDGDAIIDIEDLDDDNDGILDSDECPNNPKKILIAHCSDNGYGIRANMVSEYKNNAPLGSTVVLSSTLDDGVAPVSGKYDGYDFVVFGGNAGTTVDASEWAALQTAIVNKTSKAFVLNIDFCCNVANKTAMLNLLNTVYGTNYSTPASQYTATGYTTINSSNIYATSFSSLNSINQGYYFPINGVASQDILYYAYNGQPVTSQAMAGMKTLPGTTEKNRFITWFADGTIYQSGGYYTSNQNNIATSIYNAFNVNGDVSKCDTDKDGVPNALDLDSDGDGCEDAVEGDAGYTNFNLVSSSMPGGNSGTNYNGSSTTSVTKNLGNVVGNTAASMGVPTIAGAGQDIGFSQNILVNGCNDTDGDGIIDLDDIDDDNDGIVDSVENNCSNQLVNNGTFTQPNQNAPTGYIVSGNAMTWNNALAFNGGDVTPNAIVQQNITTFPNQSLSLTYTQYSTGGGAGTAGVKVEIIENGIAIATKSQSFATGGTQNVVLPFYTSTGSFTIKITDISQNTLNIDAYIDDLSIISTICDSDGDGIINSKDLDSDNDGCSDALEAGATNSTTVNFVFAGPFGTNGLANSKETIADNGIINYTLNYNYAINPSIKGCTDTDGDGVFDLYDLDDDNDGILDTDEGFSCVSSFTTCQIFSNPVLISNNLVLNGDFENGANGFSTTYVPGGGGCSQYAISTTGFGPAGGSCSKGNFMSVNADCSPPLTYFWSETITVKPNTNYKFGFSYAHQNPGSIGFTINGGAMQGNVNTTASWSTYQKTINSGSSSTLTINLFELTGQMASADFAVDDIYLLEETSLYCTQNIIDTDNDGIPNYKDLDSDNDGCSDAFEAGATTSKTDSIISGPFGTNGLANSKETIADNGIVNYTLNYNFAINNTIKTCVDTDGDGIFDYLDIDDDNDGIPDVKENCLMSDPSIVSTYTRTTGNYALVDGTNNFTKRGAVQITSAAVSGTSGVYGTPQNAIATGDCVSNSAADVGVRDVTFSKPITNAIILTDGFEKINEYQDIEILTPFSGTPEFVLLNNTFGATLTKISSTKYRVKSGATCNNYSVCPSSLTLQIKGAFYSKIRISGDDPTDASSCRFIKIGLDDATTDECNIDVDNDGIPNELDLDSDNDGCSDAFEAGATTSKTDSIIPGPYGTNGLANSKETVADNGIINYNLTYNFATSSSLKLCLDTDGDGVSDLDDIDDDNDGIIDFKEKNCTSPIDNTLENTAVSAFGSIGAPYTNCAGDIDIRDSNILNGTKLVPYSGNRFLTFHSSGNGTPLEKFEVSLSSALSPNTLNSIHLAIAVMPNGVRTWNNPGRIKIYGSTTSCAETKLLTTTPTINSASSGWNLVELNFIPDQAYTRLKFVVEGTNNLESYMAVDEIFVNCNSTLDTDGDGIPNQLDLDSDNDGCSDAYEAGATKNTSANYKFPGGYGTNGLDNTLETIADNGIINYTLTYSRATSASIKSCLTPDVSPNTGIDSANNLKLCQISGGSRQLSANLNPANSGGTINWYTSATGGTASSTAPTISLSNPTSVSHWVSQTINGVESPRVEIKVIVSAVPSAPTSISGPTQIAPNGISTHSISPVANATGYVWTLPNGFKGNSTTTSIIDTAGTTGGTISVQASNNGCLSASTSINVVVSNKPSNPTITTDTIKLCQNATASPLTATTNPSNNGGTLNWYTSATGGTASSTAPTPSTSFASVTTFYVSQTVSGVESDRVPIVVIVNPTPNQPNPIAGNTSVTTNTSYTYSVGAVTGATSYTWTLPNGWTGSSTTNSISVNTDTVTSGIISVRANIGNCSSAVQTLKVGSLPSKPDVSNNTNLIGDSIIYCQGVSANTLTANLNPSNNGGTLKWYTTSVGGNPSTTAPTPSTTTAGTTSYFVSQTVNGIESERAEIKVIVKPTPNQPNAIQGNTTVSSNTNYTYSVGAVTGATSYTWTLPSGWSGTSTTNSISINTNNITSGTISVTANTGNCSSAAQTLSLGAMPLDPDISGNTNISGDSVVYCQNAPTTQLTAKTNPSNNGGTLKWYTTPTGGTSSATAPTPSSTTAGTTIYYVSQTVNGVESNRVQIRVIVKPIPNQPNAIQGNTNVTANSNFTYSIGSVTGATSYTWTIPSGWSGSSTTTSISVTTNTTTSGTISVVANLNGCSSAAQTITIGTLPNNPTSGLAGDSISYCQNATAAQLTATTNPSNNGGTLKWYTTAVGGTASLTAPTPSTTLLGTTIYYVSQTVNNVESNRTAIKVVVTNQNCATPCYTSKPVLGSNQIFNNCPKTTADLTTVSASNQPVGAIVTWHTALPATASNKISNPTAVNAGAYYAVFFNPSTGCYADSGRAGTSILVTITDCSKCNSGTSSPLLNTTGISNICPSTTADLTKITASNQPSGTVLEWHSSLPITANNKVANPSQVTAGIYYAVFFDATNNCYSNNGQGYTPIVVSITSCPNPCNAGATAPSLASTVLTNICPSTTVNLTNVTASNTPSGASISWHTGLPATSSNKVSNPSSVLAGVYYAVFFDATNNCYSGAGYGSYPVVVTITNCPDPCSAGKTAPLLSMDSAQNVCPATTVNLNNVTASNQPSGTVLEWHTGLPATAGNKVSNTAAVVAGTYYAIFFDATNNCYANQGFGAKQFIVSTTNCGPACTAGNFSPNVDKNVISNVCPSTTVNLNTITASNQPKNTSISWHTSIPATSTNKISNPQSYGIQGTVYAVFYDATNNCYNQGGNSGTEVTVVITSCPNPCKSGTENPKLSATDITNICPASTSNLSTLTASNLPSGAVLEWHTGLPITANNKLTNTTNVNSGTYYAVFYDATNNCYSNNGLAATQVLVANTSCPKCLVPSVAPEIPTASIATECPSTTANLNNIVVVNKPKGVVIKWYTAAAVSNATLVTNPSAVTAGTYYATFYDTANNCFANSGNGNFTSVTVSLTKCCNAGNEAPKFNINTLTNICPSITVDLTAAKAINQPTNLVLEWHTATPVSASTKVKDISKVNAGTYYAVFYDPTNGCYSVNGQLSTPLTVSTKTCTTCNAGNSSPELSTTSVSNTCPSTTVDLTKVLVSNQPAGTVLEWHTTTPVSKATKVEDYTKVGAGTYYAIFYDPTNTCYANNGIATSKIEVYIRNCNAPCNAGENAPKLNKTAISNVCPSTTADLTTISASNVPNGAVLEWHTATPATASNKVASPSSVSAGTYYAVYFDATNNCYSVIGNGTTPVIVVIGNCTNPTKCDTFKSSPILAKDTTVNTCPSLTANLNSLVSATTSGTIVTWHTATPATDANKISNATSVGAGTYYAVLYDTSSKCYAMKGYATKRVTVTINNCPVCNSGNEAPIIDKQSLMNACPTATADLTSIKVSNLPKNTIMTWHTATPATDANKVSNPSAINTVGVYYAAFYDPTNGCYSGNGKSTFPVQVDITNCNSSCASGTNAPQLGATTLKNTCPSATADLTSINASNKPSNSNVVLQWHTGLPTTDFNKVSNPSSVPSGTYYAVFYDVVNKCYAGNGKATTSVIVSVDNCSPKCNAGNAQPYFGTDSLLNKCPLTTANLLTLIAQNQPKGTIVEWRNASGAVISNPSAVTAGTYTAYFKDTINNCYSSGTPNTVQVKIVSCAVNGANNDYVQFDSRSKGPKEIQTATNDTKTSGSKYSITPNGSPKKGTAIIDPVTGKITYVITDTSYIGYDTITYQLCDTITNQCSTAYVIISLSHPKDTTVTNNSDANSSIVIDGDKISGVPTKPSGASQQYAITTNPSGGSATVDSNGKVTYTRNPNSCGKDSIQVTRTYSFKDGRPNETYTYWIYVYNACADEEAFPNYITPNGDGKNDQFVIPDSYLKKYPGAKLVIFNRWGNIVWRSVGAYKNDWSGVHYDNSNLPDGVYYYIIELKDQFGEIKNGFIQIMRD